MYIFSQMQKLTIKENVKCVTVAYNSCLFHERDCPFTLLQFPIIAVVQTLSLIHKT